MARLAGVTGFMVDGFSYDLVDTVSYNPTTMTREMLVGVSGFAGYKELPTIAEIKAEIRDNGGMTVGDWNAMTNSTVQIVLANGKTIVGTNCFTVDAQEVNAVEGTFSVTFKCPQVIELTT